ncbi:hypothetical protein HYH03_000094 [Edaphochlamys debaryana]|uniref:Uncharacterized protein n=1 Tax=Edaphochlamys debaryana TaxID=47281 RepID=A0A835YPQ5_9CHLO|nr:hypothetical protein HYH03_000094 [Edaphochlamys debaryana]|eukprot:KAG2501589.1 hypothetical protein HYH03_000094 [Edaphochlamys debaryana]
MAAACCRRGCVEVTLDLITISALDAPAPSPLDSLPRPSVASSGVNAAASGAQALQRRPSAQSTCGSVPSWGGVDVRTVVSALGLVLGPGAHSNLHVELMEPGSTRHPTQTTSHQAAAAPDSDASGSDEGHVTARRTGPDTAVGRGRTGEGGGGGEGAPRSGLLVQVQVLGPGAGAGMAGREGPWLSELQPRLLTVHDAANPHSPMEQSGAGEAVVLRARMLRPLDEGETCAPAPTVVVRSGGAFLPVQVAAWGRAPAALAVGLADEGTANSGHSGASGPALGVVIEDGAEGECGVPPYDGHANVLYDGQAYEVYELELRIGRPQRPGVVLLELAWHGHPSTSAVPLLVLREEDAEVAAELAGVLEVVPPLPPPPPATVSTGPGCGPDGDMQALSAWPLDGLLLDLGVWAQATEAAPALVTPLQLAALAGSLLRFTEAVGLPCTHRWVAAGAERLGLGLGPAGGPEQWAPIHPAPLEPPVALRCEAEGGPWAPATPVASGASRCGGSGASGAVVEVGVEAEECKLAGSRYTRPPEGACCGGAAASKAFPAQPQRALGSAGFRALQRALGLERRPPHRGAFEAAATQPHAELGEHILRAAAALCVLCALLLLCRSDLLGARVWDLLPETAGR